MVQPVFTFSTPDPDKPLAPERVRTLSMIPLTESQADIVFGGKNVEYLEGLSAVAAFQRYQEIYKSHRDDKKNKNDTNYMNEMYLGVIVEKGLLLKARRGE